MSVEKKHPIITKLRGLEEVVNKVKRSLLPGGRAVEVKCSVVFVVPDDVKDSYVMPQSILDDNTDDDGSVVRRKGGRQYHADFINEDNQYRLVMEY